MLQGHLHCRNTSVHPQTLHMVLSHHHLVTQLSHSLLLCPGSLMGLLSQPRLPSLIHPSWGLALPSTRLGTQGQDLDLLPSRRPGVGKVGLCM